MVISNPAQQWQIELDADDAAAYAVLSQDRVWNGYSIGDLVPPFRAYTQIALARGASEPEASACLLLRHPAFSAMVLSGPAAGLAAVLPQLELPERVFLLARAEHVPVVERHYDAEAHEMLRMAVTRASFQPVARQGVAVERLDSAALPELQALYDSYGENAFNADQLRNGVFYGVRVDGALVAAGGTHVLAQPYGIAAVGNIYTLPALRGRGYAAAVTSAVVAELLAGPYSDVILNVSVSNLAAVRIYQRLGFWTHCHYYEGPARRR